jgi:hypothetical protein
MYHATSSSSVAAANSAPDRRFCAAEETERLRGLRSFLTWSFFLAQIAAAEQFVGAAAHAAQDAEPAGHVRSPDADGVAQSQPRPDAPIAASPDPIPGGAVEKSAALPDASIQPVAAEAAYVPVQSADVQIGAQPGPTVVIGGGAASAGAGQPDELHELPFGGDVIPDNLLPLNVPALLGDVVDLAGDTLSAIGSSLADALALAGAELLPGELALSVGLMLSGDEVSAQLTGYATHDEMSVGVSASGSAGLAPYTDLLLALSDDSSASEPALASPGSLLQSLPIIGDVLVLHSPSAMHDQAPGLPAIAETVADAADHIGLGKADLWS